jgi:hypothetical protein
VGGLSEGRPQAGARFAECGRASAARLLSLLPAGNRKASVWELMHFALLSWLARNGDVDWSRAVVDSCSVRAVRGGTQTGPNPTNRAKRGSKRHLIGDARGVPLAIRLTGAN